MLDSQSARVRQALLERYLRGEVPGLAGQPERPAATATADPRAPVIAVQTEGSKHPFFLLHGSSEGAAHFCYMLARSVGIDQPLYALEPYTQAVPALPPLEDIAAAHIRSLRSVQAEGPYLLGGICNGGLIAFEMARQLQAEGQNIALLVLMDPWPAGRGSPPSHRFARWAIAQGAALRHWDAQKQLAIFRQIHQTGRAIERLLRRSAAWGEMVWASRVGLRASAHGNPAAREAGATASSGAYTPPASCRASGGPSCSASGGCELLPYQYSALFRWAALTYDPPHPYDGVVTYFWPSQGVGNRRGWRMRVRPHDATYVVTGTQDSWRSDDLPALALQLRSCLDAAHARIGVSSAHAERPQTKEG